MLGPLSPASIPTANLDRPSVDPSRSDPDGVDQRLETLLWAEMLAHAGLEDALTLGGGEGATSFARYVVEEIAADLSERHPLGIGEKAVSNTLNT